MEPRGSKRKAETQNKHIHKATSLPTNPALYSGPFPFYRRPSELGCFSLDAQRQYHGDARACATTAHPPPTVKALTSTSEMDTLIDTSLGMRRSKSGWTTCYDGSWITADSWRGVQAGWQEPS